MIKLNKETKVTSSVIRSIMSQIACNVHNELSRFDKVILDNTFQFELITKQPEEKGEEDLITGFAIKALSSGRPGFNTTPIPDTFIRFEVFPFKSEKPDNNEKDAVGRLVRNSSVFTTGVNWVSVIISSVLTATANWDQVLVEYYGRTLSIDSLNVFKNVRIFYSNGVETICVEINIRDLFETIQNRTSFNGGFNNHKSINEDGTAVPYLPSDIEKLDNERNQRRRAVSVHQVRY